MQKIKRSFSTYHMDNFNGIPIGIPNDVIESENRNFYVSYNNFDTAIYGSDTTALVLDQMQHFYILNGDHREQYAELIPKGFDACMQYFKNHIHLINEKFSEKPTE